jgi:hypothetical protein
MGIWETIKAVFAPNDAPRLRANNESELSASIRTLRVGERGWIALSEARSLFSQMDDQYAFGEIDDEGKSNLAAFAAQTEHRSTFDFMPTEGRVYFTRKPN